MAARSALSFALPVTVPGQTGVKPFQSMQPAVSIARLPSASSKPEASAIVPSAPQPVIEASGALEPLRESKSELRAFESEENLCKSECRAIWVELFRLPAATRLAELCCTATRPEAAPTISNEATTKATITVAPTRLRRRRGRPNFPVLID